MRENILEKKLKDFEEKKVDNLEFLSFLFF